VIYIKEKNVRVIMKFEVSKGHILRPIVFIDMDLFSIIVLSIGIICEVETKKIKNHGFYGRLCKSNYLIPNPLPYFWH
jgi:hypothetical protein